MPALVWDSKLETVATNYADLCIWDHNDDATTDYANVGGSGYVGENLAVSWAPSSSSDPTAAGTIQGWIDEEDFWTFPQTCQSGKMCGHWTQVIWADTTKVGCAVKRNCASMAGLTIPSGYKIAYIVCNYAVGGNWVGEDPYVRTTPSTPSAPSGTPTTPSTPSGPTPSGPAPSGPTPSNPSSPTTTPSLSPPSLTPSNPSGTPSGSPSRAAPASPSSALASSLLVLLGSTLIYVICM